MNYLEAIEVRSSRRAYTEQDIDKEAAEQLKKLLAEINRESGLNLQLYLSTAEGITGLKMSYGMFKNVRNFIALVGNREMPHLKEKIGYYGEKLLLHATTLNLGSCWVGGTFDRKSCNQKAEQNISKHRIQIPSLKSGR